MSACSSPAPATSAKRDAGQPFELGTRIVCNHGVCVTSHYSADGGVLELSGQAGAGAEAAGAAANAGAGGEASADDPRSSGTGGADPTNTDVSDAGPLERDAMVTDTNDSPADAGVPVDTRTLCTDTCIDGTFKCASASAKSGFVCRMWPPCYCNPDAGK